MRAARLLSTLYHSAQRIPFGNETRIVIMSDCHRGDGGHSDNFLRNQHICFAALNYYFFEKYIYIELGDGDELWENKTLSAVIDAHKDVFWRLSAFHRQNRLYMVYGNHDIVKGIPGYAEQNMSRYYDERQKKWAPLFPDIQLHEGLVLKDKESGEELFLVHGHQVDYLNERLWKLARFLVRYLWKPLETIGVNDPTSAAKNYEKKEAVEKALAAWAERENLTIVAGHTHRPAFPEAGRPRYFNAGSCVHPRCITAIEITGGNITLVKWCVKTKMNGDMYIGREILAGPMKLREFGK